jgi:peptidoglycan/xylan/chitin deacetylase (PgdA/CDA1 family)
MRSAGTTRRTLLAGFAASLAGATAARAASCWTPAQLAGMPGEAAPHPPGAADAFAMPTPAEPGSPVIGAFAGVIRRMDRPDKAIALTFDLCQTRSPIAGYDGAIVDYLRAEQIAATFFCCGRWLGTHGTRAAQLVSEPRFVAANHSFGHPDLHSAPADRVRREILLTEAMLATTRRAAIGACVGGTAPGAMRLFRFPFGSCSPAAVAAANAAGSVIIQWDVVSGDPDGTSAATIQKSVLGGARPGSIVVMHANGRGTHTAEALRTIVPKLRGEGYRFVTVPELLAVGKPVIATECYINRPGDTLRYDEIASHPPGKAAPAVVRPHT